MPQPMLPPTPASSTDIAPKPAPRLSNLELSFKLPPPALTSSSTSVSSSTSSSSSASLSEIVVKGSQNEFMPPSESRKIIQMKPKTTASSSASTDAANTITGATANKGRATTASGRKKTAASSTVTGVSSQQPIQTTQVPTKPTAATRKTARKTAHSLIERRRRFKMNEEFAMLKNMIPACQGVEMHKLAILQASIEYLRYLEDCVEKLKRSNGGGEGVDQDGEDDEGEGEREEDEDEEEGREDEILEDERGASGGDSNGMDLTFIPQQQPPQQQQQQHQYHAPHHYQQNMPSPSPSQRTQNHPRTHSISSNFSSHRPSPSPHFHHHHVPQHAGFITTQNIPAQLLPPPREREREREREVDREATHALLLLAGESASKNVERSNWSASASATPVVGPIGGTPAQKGRTMSVLDLLSS
ncbi:hypothetical protein BDZ91DRAFT_772758 [Kalaharituber pfeilii]|nr:hypothetical protein BDZ91DRAFT_772758 [Kalaharituber pfeilii]